MHYYHTRSYTKKLFNSKQIISTNTYQNLTIKPKNISKYYANSDTIIRMLVDLPPMSFGTVMEGMVKEFFNLSSRTCSQNDACLDDIKIEIKSSRFWDTRGDFKWQHIEPDHDWDILLCVALMYDGLWIGGLTKSQVMKYIRRKIIKPQGQQGFWVWKNHINPIPIKNNDDLLQLIHSI